MRLPGVMRGIVEGVGAGGGRDGPPESPPGAVGALGAVGTLGLSSGAVPAPRPRFASIAHLAWWDGVSHVVTRPGSRARHLTREIVT